MTCAPTTARRAAVLTLLLSLVATALASDDASSHPIRPASSVDEAVLASDDAAYAAIEAAAQPVDDAIAPHHRTQHHHTRTTVTVTKWYGRLGNNIHQIRHAVKVAVCCNGVLQLPDTHYLLNMTQTTFDVGPGAPAAGRACPANLSGEFFFVNHVRTLGHKIYHECDADVEALWSAVTGSLFPRSAHLCQTHGTPDCCPPDMDDVLVAHVRSGDLFSSKEPSRFYFPAPLVYYARVMTERPWSRVVLVTEDDLNPVTTILGSVMKGALSSAVDVFSQRLEDDVHMLRCAVHVAIARSTFSERLAGLAANLRTVYSPYKKECPKKGVAGVFFTFPNFNDTHWANSPDQINDMVRQSEVVRQEYVC